MQTENFTSESNLINKDDIISEIEGINAFIETMKAEGDTGLLAYRQAHDALAAVIKLADDIKSECPDWLNGAMLIRETYWETFVQDELEDTGVLRAANLPSYVSIDWKKTAQDYRVEHATPAVQYEGITYYIVQ